jgi:UDP-N-acetylglucosamine 4-epimerase
MSAYETLQTQLQSKQHTWLITGVSGFIGSNLLESLLQLNQKVVGLDNFSTGHQRNLDEVKSMVTPAQWQNLNFMQADICNLASCQTACTGLEFVLHQAALGTVPRSEEDPMMTYASKVTGIFNMLVASQRAKSQALCLRCQHQHLKR